MTPKRKRKQSYAEERKEVLEDISREIGEEFNLESIWVVRDEEVEQ